MIFTISSCREEMEDPHAGLDELTADRVASVREQISAIKTTASLLDDYASSLKDGLGLPELEGAGEEIEQAAASLSDFMASHRNSDDHAAVTEATIRMHADLSLILAKLPATVEVMMILSPSEELSSSYASLHKDHIKGLTASVNSWLGQGILPDLYAKEKLSLQLSLMKEMIIDKEHAFATQIVSLIDTFESQENSSMTSEDFISLMSSVIENDGGILDAVAESKVKEYGESVDAILDEVGSAYIAFASAVEESVQFMASIQSLAFLSEFDKDRAIVEYSYDGYGVLAKSDFSMSFTVRPAYLAATLVEDWETYFSLLSYTPASGPVLSDNPPVIEDVTINGDILTVYVDPANIGTDFYSGNTNISVALEVSNGLRSLTSEFVGLKPKKMPGLFFDKNIEQNIPVVKGTTHTIQFEYTASSKVAMTVTGNEFIGTTDISYDPESNLSHKTGYVYVNINESHDVSKQRVVVTLTADGETVTRTLTFTEAGYINASTNGPLPASGGETTISFDTNIDDENPQSTITSGTDWLSKTSTFVFSASVNETESPRAATIQFTVGGFKKTVKVVQYGTNSSYTCFEMFLGDWQMTATDAVTGSQTTFPVTVTPDSSVEDGYLVTGLSPGSGASHPVRMKYVYGTGMTLTVPQAGIDGGELGLYKTSRNGTTLSASTATETYTFTWNGSTLAPNMSSSNSFSYWLNDDGTFTQNASDKVFYHTSSLERKQPEYYEDGVKVQLYSGNDIRTYPLNIIILGDGYQKKDLQKGGKFYRSANSAMNTIFAYEPFASFKDRFNVYMIPYASSDEGTSIENEGVTKNTRYGMTCRSNGNTLLNAPHGYDNVWTDIANAGFYDNDVYKSLVIMLVNTDLASGTCAQIERGTTTSAAVSGDGYKSKSIAMLAANNSFGTNGLVIHEAGGHGFGRLADEYTSESGNTFTAFTSLQNSHDVGFYWNVSPHKDDRCPWYKFYTNDQYSGKVGFYESAYNCQYGIYRPSDSSIMLNNTGTFNVISRWAIYRRIIMTSEGGGTESDVLARFLEYDKKNL